MSTFDPNNYAVKNDNFIGLPFDAESAKIIFLPVPWEVTVSYYTGTAEAPANILAASYQLDLYDADVKDAWKLGIYMQAVSEEIEMLNEETRALASQHIERLEAGEESIETEVQQINHNCQELENWVYQQTKNLLSKGKLIGLIGGEHSVPLGYLKALAEKHSTFGILQIDAHFDLRKAYEELTHSHASIFYNVLEQIPAVEKLVAVGIRDCCQAEVDYQEANKNRVQVFYDQAIKEAVFEGKTFAQLCAQIIDVLPQKVYISFDIDGLDPKLCPNTGTPVAGGLELAEAFYLCKRIVQSGREIIGFDLCEVGSASEWDGNVGARVAYKLANLMGSSVLLKTEQLKMNNNV